MTEPAPSSDPVRRQVVRGTSLGAFLCITTSLTLVAAGGISVLVKYGSEVGSVVRGLPLEIMGSPGSRHQRAVVVPSAPETPRAGGVAGDAASGSARPSAQEDRRARPTPPSRGAGSVPAPPAVAPTAPRAQPVTPSQPSPTSAPSPAPTGPGQSADKQQGQGPGAAPTASATPRRSPPSGGNDRPPGSSGTSR